MSVVAQTQYVVQRTYSEYPVEFGVATEYVYTVYSVFSNMVVTSYLGLRVVTSLVTSILDKDTGQLRRVRKTPTRYIAETFLARSPETRLISTSVVAEERPWTGAEGGTSGGTRTAPGSPVPI
jgi:hypothetical protein